MDVNKTDAQNILRTSQPLCTRKGVRVFALSGPDSRPFGADMARLRIDLFKVFPYLYEGAPEDEAQYLEMYFDCTEARVLLAEHEGRIVGFSSSIPLENESQEVLKAYTDQGLNPEHYLYCGEALLNPMFRGSGLLRIYHEYHENKARALHRSHTTLMTVNRKPDHPLRTAKTTPIETFLHHFGYAPIPACVVHASWKQVDTGCIEANTLTVWCKELTPTS